jgi:2-iminobutanoate/2-iminopropanoate deaminase
MMQQQGAIQIFKPTSVFPSTGYNHAVRGGKLLFIAGQTAVDASGNLIGEGDFWAQAEQVYTNLKNVVEEAGGTLNDVMKVTNFVTDISQYPVLFEVRRKFFTGDMPASTLVQISSLARPEFMVEIEAVVVLD